MESARAPDPGKGRVVDIDIRAAGGDAERGVAPPISDLKRPPGARCPELKHPLNMRQRGGIFNTAGALPRRPSDRPETLLDFGGLLVNN